MDAVIEKRGYLLEDFRLFHLRSEGVDGVGFHYHDFHKVVMVLSGSGAYVVEGRRYLLQPGDVVLVSRGSIHCPEIGKGSSYERAVFYISDEYLKGHKVGTWNPSLLFSECSSHVLRLTAEVYEQFCRDLALLESWLAHDSPESVLMSRCRFMCMLLSLYSLATGGSRTTPLPAEPGDEKVIAIIHSALYRRYI